jgi:ADP-ribose pyrophosphatase YjhB (NUDIX family)
VGAIVVDDDGRVLLVRRANPPAQGMWSIPGGRQEPGESAAEGAIRELLEETGLAGEVVREVGTVRRDAPAGGQYVIRDFLVRVVGSSTPVAGDDASDAAWFTPDEVRGVETSAGLVDALVDWGFLGT